MDMSALRYVVSIEDHAFGDWAVKAAFQWFTDARAYAIRLSKTDRLGRVVTVAHLDGTRPNYFKDGAALYDLADAEHGDAEAVTETPVTIPLSPTPHPIMEGWE